MEGQVNTGGQSLGAVATGVAVVEEAAEQCRPQSLQVQLRVPCRGVQRNPVRRKGAHDKRTRPAVSEGATVDESADHRAEASRPGVPEGDFGSGGPDLLEDPIGGVHELRS